MTVLAAAALIGLPHAPAVASQKAKSERDGSPRGPLTLIVSIADQSLSVYDGDKRIARTPVSTGRRGYDTPTGVFSVIQKNRVHFSNLYNEAPMPFMQRITWSGIALHGGPLPGYPASHGCIRLPHGFAKQLFGQTRMGARVIVSRSPTAPTRIGHSNLFADVRPISNDKPTLQARAGAMHLGGAVTPASGGTATDAPDATFERPPVPLLMQEATAKLEASAEEMRAATTARAAAAAELSEIARAADVARAELLQAKREVEQERRKLTGVQAEIAKVKSQMERILDQSVHSQNDHLDRLGDREDALEARLLAVNDDAIDAQLQLALVEGSLPELEQIYKTAHQRRIATLRQVHEATDAYQRAATANEDARKSLSRMHLPLHMLVSRKTGKLHVRQGYQPLMDVAVEIRDPERPIGTHVFTADEVGPDGVSWSAVSVPEQAGKPSTTSSQSRNGRRETRDKTPHARVTATEAMDRVRIPDEVRRKLGEILKPGASIIVSDHAPSRETGRGTDIIVQTR